MKNVLIVDDSKIIREIIKAILSEDPEFNVIGEVESGEEAIDFVRKNKPDVVTMDVNLKGKDGLYATREIMAENPVPIVIMSTLFNPKDKEQVFKALSEGAISVFEKPKALGSPDFEEYAEKLRNELKILSQIKPFKRKRKVKSQKVIGNENNLLDEILRLSSSGIKFVAIGASTGGPNILNEIFHELKPDFNLPIVVVQHITPGFLDSLVSWINSNTKLNVKIATDGEKISSGSVYFAPDGKHLTVTKELHVEFSDAPPVNSCKPSVSVFFDSVARNFGKDVIAILLTGMGRDGAKELLKIKENGAVTIAQDESSSVVFGMPKAAIDLNATKFILSKDEIINFLNNI